MCKIAPNAADFDCPELERAVERSRRWDPIFRSGMSRPASSDDAIVFSEALSEAAVKNQKLVAEKAELRARVGAMDMVNAAQFNNSTILRRSRRRFQVGARLRGRADRALPPSGRREDIRRQRGRSFASSACRSPATGNRAAVSRQEHPLPRRRLRLPRSGQHGAAATYRRHG
jgi:hypothetical protein